MQALFTPVQFPSKSCHSILAYRTHYTTHGLTTQKIAHLPNSKNFNDIVGVPNVFRVVVTLLQETSSIFFSYALYLASHSTKILHFTFWHVCFIKLIYLNRRYCEAICCIFFCHFHFNCPLSYFVIHEAVPTFYMSITSKNTGEM